MSCTAHAISTRFSIPIYNWPATAIKKPSLWNFLRPLRGVNKQYLWDYLAVFEAATNSKRITPPLVQALCFGYQGMPLNYT